MTRAVTTRLAQLEQIAKLASELRSVQRLYERESTHSVRVVAKALERELGALRFDPEGGESDNESESPKGGLMPTAPPHPCADCGLPIPRGGARCRACAQAYERRRGSPTQRGRGYAYQVERRAILERDGYVCQLCGDPGADTVDHIVPVGQGGTHDPSNLRAAHRECNSARR